MINEPVKPAPTETQDQMRLFRDMPFVKFWAYWPFLGAFRRTARNRRPVVDSVSVPAARYSWGIKSPKKINGEDNENVVMLCVSKRQDLAFAGEAHERRMKGKHCNAQY